MKRSLLAVFLLFAGCSAGSPASPSPAGATPTAVATVAPTVAPTPTTAPTVAPTCDPYYGSCASPSVGASNSPSPQGNVVVIGQSSGATPHFLGPNGNALYTFDNDSGTSSACNTGCVDTWPPLTVQAGSTVQAGGHEEDFATITREDGSLQLTYYGKPLYNYSGDTSATDINGDGLFGRWHLAIVQP